MKLSTLLLASWLILTGLLQITNLRIEMAAFVLGALAIAAGITLLFGK